MSFGKLYSFKGNARTTALLAVAKENKLDVELVHTEPGSGELSADYLKLNRLGKIPTFHGADGFVLTEAVAIAVYLTSQNEKTTLLGKTKQDYASILRWTSFANTEVLPALGGWFRPLVGKDPYNKKNVEDSQKKTLAALKVIEDHLLVHTYLVGERVTLADLFLIGPTTRGFQNVFDKKWRSEFPNITRWYETLINAPILAGIVEGTDFIEEAVKYTPPKKEAPVKKEQPKAAPKAAEPEEEEETAPPEPKAKHPLADLPKATFVLDELKREYSNKDTPEVLKWFWEKANFEEYSLWRADYKDPQELPGTTWQTSNLISGFFNRLDGSRKYIFGSSSVYSAESGRQISGAFFLRGQEAAPAFDVAWDADRYNYTKLDPSNPEDKEFVEAQWSWEKPLVLNGTTYDWADGKVFK